MFKINITNREVFTLFDTGATRSVMSGQTFRDLKLNNKDLDTSNLPTIVGANGASLGAISKINCEIEIEKKFKQTFLLCENLTRSLILGVDFTRKQAAGVHLTKQNSFVLTINGETVAETRELHQNAAVSLKKMTKLPPRSSAVMDIDINTTSTEKIQLMPDKYCLTQKTPNMYMHNLYADLSQRTKDSIILFVIVKFSNDQYLEFPKNHVIAFAEKDDTEGEVFEIEQVDTTPRHWMPLQPK